MKVSASFTKSMNCPIVGQPWMVERKCRVSKIGHLKQSIKVGWWIWRTKSPKAIQRQPLMRLRHWNGNAKTESHILWFKDLFDTSWPYLPGNELLWVTQKIIEVLVACHFRDGSSPLLHLSLHVLDQTRELHLCMANSSMLKVPRAG